MSISAVRSEYGTPGEASATKMAGILHANSLDLRFNSSHRNFTILKSAHLNKEDLEKLLAKEKYEDWAPVVLDEISARGNHLVAFQEVKKPAAPKPTARPPSPILDIISNDPLKYEVRPNIFVVTDDKEFLKKVKSDLDTIESKDEGKRLISEIGKGKHLVTIKFGDKNKCTPDSINDGQTNGVGTDSTIIYRSTQSWHLTTEGLYYSLPPFIILAHELIHAYHNSYGNNAINLKLDSFDENLWTTPEELLTIEGLPSKKTGHDKPEVDSDCAIPTKKRKIESPPITENTILREHGLPKRFSHLGTSIGSLEAKKNIYEYLQKGLDSYASKGDLEKANELAKKIEAYAISANLVKHVNKKLLETKPD